MKSKEELSCQWVDCDTPAEKHVEFGLRVFDIAPGMHTSGIPYTRDHRNLCEKHIGRARLEYLDFTAFELGTCSNQPTP